VAALLRPGMYSSGAGVVGAGRKQHEIEPT
jgi:hypothetical protein